MQTWILLPLNRCPSAIRRPHHASKLQSSTPEVISILLAPLISEGGLHHILHQHHPCIRPTRVAEKDGIDGRMQALSSTRAKFNHTTSGVPPLALRGSSTLD